MIPAAVDAVMAVRRTAARCCLLAALLLLVAACSGPSQPMSSPGGLRDGLELNLASDDPLLHGAGVLRPRVVTLPTGGFLLFMREDTPAGGRLLRSLDGSRWTAVPDGEAPPLERLTDLAATTESVVVLGEDLQARGGAGAPAVHAFRSTDGVTWVPVADPSGLRAVGAGTLVAGSSGFAALGAARDAIGVAGPDGDRWSTSRVALPDRSSLAGVAAADPGFVVWGTVQGEPVAWRMRDGEWAPMPPSGRDGFDAGSMAWSGPRGVAVGWAPVGPFATDDEPMPIILHTADGGDTWAELVAEPDGSGQPGAFAVAGMLLVTEIPEGRHDPAAWRSIESIGWQEVTIEPPGITGDQVPIGSVASDGRRIVVAGNTVGTGAGGDRVVIWTGSLP